MSAHAAELDDIVHVSPPADAELHFVGRTVEPLYNYTFDPPPGAEKTNFVDDPHVVTIRNARVDAADATLDREGFELLHHRSTVQDFYDEDELRRVYYPETERAIAAATGASRVFVFDHTVRRRIYGANDRVVGLPRQPVPRVHVDQTEKSGPQRVRDLMGDEAEALLRGRVQVVNLWRPIRGPLRDAPLAMADARTVAPEDLVGSSLIYADRVGETYAVKFNPAQQWFFVPDMQPDEALLLKCYDSATDGRARFAPHTAFEDPTPKAYVPPRESIEMRALVFSPA
jgi:hypothetical protein